MQVSIACTDHNLKRGNGDHSKQSATSPNVVNQARAKFRTVAIIARSFGSFTPRHISLKESTGKHTGMKYRCVCVCAQVYNVCFPLKARLVCILLYILLCYWYFCLYSFSHLLQLYYFFIILLDFHYKLSCLHICGFKSNFIPLLCNCLTPFFVKILHVCKSLQRHALYLKIQIAYWLISWWHEHAVIVSQHSVATK